MSKPLDLESLKGIFRDNRIHIAIGKVTEVALSSDRSGLSCMVALFPDKREIVCRMTWDIVGPESGVFSFPQVADLVLVAFAEGDFNQAFIIRRLTSREDKIPKNATVGDLVVKALPSKNTWITGSKVRISKGDTTPTEPLVLGAVLISALGSLIDKFDAALEKIATGPIGIGNLGAPVPTSPGLVSELSAIRLELDTIKSTYLENESTNIVSKFSFTER